MERFIKAVALLLLVTMLASCATPYQKRGFGGGYHETKIDQNNYIVYFDGNGESSEQRIWSFWIYRCAQLTLENGYTYFSLSRVLNNMNKATAFDPDEGGHAYPAVLIGDANGHLIDVHAGGYSGVILVPGGTIVSWHSKAVVTMYGQIVPQKTLVVRAQTVIDMLDAYIKSGGTTMPPDRTSIANAATFALGPNLTVVNVHQYLLSKLSQPARAMPNGYSTPLYAVQPSRNDDTASGPPPATAPAPSAASISPPAVTPPPAPAAALTPEKAALAAHLSMAQSVATQIGCGAVQINEGSTFIAPCGSYSVVISCDGDQCRPIHTVNAKSED
ncbi:CC0125/CC1285 family lipoprotein [Dyella mobilis]|uniref:Uncharacterized protein n=1 Tax=Dyella mobilis TaxID=1849582 RepID=A0ABS2KCU3_9GAMM|nr:hypothetical protein [Dyella mobilis]MBM7129003.1 hypothetical protein [Dyella mobilis]GLQ99302.1 hypothetical protein GCM10007863_37220 [Dyella mobilis]